MSDTMFSLHLLDAVEAVEDGAALEGISRSEFLRRGARQRLRMLERELEKETTTIDEQEERHAK